MVGIVPRRREILPENAHLLLRLLIVATFAGVACILLLTFTRESSTILAAKSPFKSPFAACNGSGVRDPGMPPGVSSALLHYATTRVIPQMTRGEITLPLKVLAARSPCNFLVFGLGHDSTLWNALNWRGRTVFLEEDSSWIREILRNHPHLRAHRVRYPTRLAQADALLDRYRSNSSCGPMENLAESKCALALRDLPAEIYDTEWDVVMIDAPRGFFDAAPGRMTAIFSAAVMARTRRNAGHTDIFLHDVNRRVEKTYANEFLCRENLVASSGRLWHFRIGPLRGAAAGNAGFCDPS